MPKNLVVLCALFASEEAVKWLVNIAHSALKEKISLVAILSTQIAKQLADLPITVYAIDNKKSCSVLLKQLAPNIIQTFSQRDHVVAAPYTIAQPCFLLATHYNPHEVIRPTLINRALYNRLTDANLLINQQLKTSLDSWFDRPCVLTQASLGETSVYLMLEHVYSSLLYPNRLDVGEKEKRDFSDIRLAYITSFYCTQHNINGITTLLARYAQYPDEIRARVHFVIVDDGSPLRYTIPDLPLNLTWIKINNDIHWNLGGVRNLAAVYARADNILLIDLDHEVPLDTMRHLIERPPCGKCIYKIWREDERGHLYRGHPNLFFMSRGRYFECYGVDEEFAGYYGSEDIRFIKYQRAQGSLQKYLPKKFRCIERRDLDPSRSPHTLVRDLSFNTPIDSRKRRELEWFGHPFGHSRMFLQFTWTLLADRQFTIPLPRPMNRSWKKRSWLRQLLPRF